MRLEFEVSEWSNVLSTLENDYGFRHDDIDKWQYDIRL